MQFSRRRRDVRRVRNNGAHHVYIPTHDDLIYLRPFYRRLLREKISLLWPRVGRVGVRL